MGGPMGPLSPFLFLAKGLLIGFTIAAPVGPVGILCIKRTLLQGRITGLATGLGAATADLMYGFIAALGLTVVADTLLCCFTYLKLSGALLLLFLGFRTFFSHPKNETQALAKTSLFGAFTSTFFLTLTNPLTLFAFLGIFSAFGFARISDEPGRDIFSLLLGVFIGSALWWLLLSEGITSFKHKLPSKLFEWVNHVAGTLLVLFGVALLANGLYELLS